MNQPVSHLYMVNHSQNKKEGLIPVTNQLSAHWCFHWCELM